MFGAKVVSIFTVVILLLSFVVWKLFLQGIEKSVRDDIQKGNRVVLLFSAKWCPTCVKQKPAYEAVKQEFPEIHFYNVMQEMNRVQQKLLFKEYNIHGIPTMILFKGGKEVSRFSGLKTEAELREKFSQL